MAHAEVNFSKNVRRKMGTPKRKDCELRAGGLSIDPVFCPVDVDDPFDTVEWDLRTAAIKGENGEVLFEQTNCEVPTFWSQLATNVVVSKYFYGENGTPRARTQRAATDPPRQPHDCRLGHSKTATSPAPKTANGSIAN